MAARAPGIGGWGGAGPVQTPRPDPVGIRHHLLPKALSPSSRRARRARPTTAIRRDFTCDEGRFIAVRSLGPRRCGRRSTLGHRQRQGGSEWECRRQRRNVCFFAYLSKSSQAGNHPDIAFAETRADRLLSGNVEIDHASLDVLTMNLLEADAIGASNYPIDAEHWRQVAHRVD